MAKATGRKAASTDAEKPRWKKNFTATGTAATGAATTRAKAPARKATTKKAAAKKRVAKKVAVRAKPAATKAKAPAKTKAAAKTVKSRRRTAAARRPAADAKSVTPRARRPKAAVLEVPPSVIDTSSAAEVAARLVADHSTVAPADSFGLIFAPPPASVVKRGSSALRHVKESLHKPVAAQLAGVFGPAPLPPQAMKRLLRGDKVARTQRVRGTTNFHSGQPTVPHRSVG